MCGRYDRDFNPSVADGNSSFPSATSQTEIFEHHLLSIYDANDSLDDVMLILITFLKRIWDIF